MFTFVQWQRPSADGAISWGVATLPEGTVELELTIAMPHWSAAERDTFVDGVRADLTMRGLLIVKEAWMIGSVVALSAHGATGIRLTYRPASNETEAIVLNRLIEEQLRAQNEAMKRAAAADDAARRNGHLHEPGDAPEGEHDGADSDPV